MVVNDQTILYILFIYINLFFRNPVVSAITYTVPSLVIVPCVLVPLSSPSRSWITHTHTHTQNLHSAWLDPLDSVLYPPQGFDSSDMDRLPTAHFGCPCFSVWQSGLEEPSHVNSGGRDILWTSSGTLHSGTDTQATLPLMVSASLQNMLSLHACMKLSNKSRICSHTLLLMSFISLLLDVSS